MAFESAGSSVYGAQPYDAQTDAGLSPVPGRLAAYTATLSKKPTWLPVTAGWHWTTGSGAAVPPLALSMGTSEAAGWRTAAITNAWLADVLAVMVKLAETESEADFETAEELRAAVESVPFDLPEKDTLTAPNAAGKPSKYPINWAWYWTSPEAAAVKQARAIAKARKWMLPNYKPGSNKNAFFTKFVPLAAALIGGAALLGAAVGGGTAAAATSAAATDAIATGAAETIAAATGSAAGSAAGGFSGALAGAVGEIGGAIGGALGAVDGALAAVGLGGSGSAAGLIGNALAMGDEQIAAAIAGAFTDPMDWEQYGAIAGGLVAGNNPELAGAIGQGSSWLEQLLGGYAPPGLLSGFAKGAQEVTGGGSNVAPPAALAPEVTAADDLGTPFPAWAFPAVLLAVVLLVVVRK